MANSHLQAEGEVAEASPGKHGEALRFALCHTKQQVGQNEFIWGDFFRRRLTKF